MSVAVILMASLALATAPGAALAHPPASPAIEPVRINKARMDAALAAMVDSGRAVGVTALVWQDGQERYFGAAGMADREQGRPMPSEVPDLVRCLRELGEPIPCMPAAARSQGANRLRREA
jgi:CubicO group peptidase (beta-lactamase class C family)